MIPEIKDIDIRELLPQKEPFILVDEFVSWDDAGSRVRFKVKEDGIMVEDGRLRPAGLVEVMAQTSAAHIGYYNKYILNKPVRIGYIGAVNTLNVNREVRVGETIEATLKILTESGNLTRMEVLLQVKNETVASGKMTLVLQ